MISRQQQVTHYPRAEVQREAVPFLGVFRHVVVLRSPHFRALRAEVRVRYDAELQQNRTLPVAGTTGSLSYRAAGSATRFAEV